MLGKLRSVIRDRRSRDVVFAVGGMGALTVGAKLPALALFTLGVWGLERSWREAHPEVGEGFRERWHAAIDFYDRTHQNKMNRVLHVVGIPMIAGGALGLLAFPIFTPPWVLSAASFGAGWTLNIARHMFFEKNQPAFSDDPLSFVAGPIWDFNQLRRQLTSSPESGALADR